MNEEIKKILDQFKPELKGNGDDTDYEMGWNECLLNIELELDKMAERLYLLGAVDMREAVIRELEKQPEYGKEKCLMSDYEHYIVSDEKGGVYAQCYQCGRGYYSPKFETLEDKIVKIKAQQFIDSLEGKE